MESDQSSGNLPTVFRPKDLPEHGHSIRRLETLLRHGKARRIARGIYRLTAEPADAGLETIAMVCARVPRAVICLGTALHLHGLGTQAPREIWIAIGRTDRRPRLPQVPLRIVRFSDHLREYAVETRTILGVKAKVTSPVRTVVDAFRYRNKIGVAVAVEALRDLLGRRMATADDVIRVAGMCRAGTIVRPYLAAMAT